MTCRRICLQVVMFPSNIGCRLSFSFLEYGTSIIHPGEQWNASNTYCKSFRQPCAKIIENNGDDVLVRDEHVAFFEVHFPCSQQIQGILKRNLQHERRMGEGRRFLIIYRFKKKHVNIPLACLSSVRMLKPALDCLNMCSNPRIYSSNI